jgi:hypothetical protein
MSPAEALEYRPTLGMKVRGMWSRLTRRRGPSPLVAHAEEEMRRAGLYDEASDYGGMIPESVMKLVKVLAEDGHSGGSHWLTMQVFNKVANFKTLTPLTNDPSEWTEVSEMCPVAQRPVYQNRRDSAMFSNDGGKTYYSVDDKERKLITAVEFEKP